MNDVSELCEKNVDLIIDSKAGGWFKIVENVSLNDEDYEYKGNKYKIREEKVEHKGPEDLFLYYRAGHSEPLEWEDSSQEFSGREIFMTKHDSSVIEGILSSLGVGGAGSLNKKQWGIIIGVGVLVAVAFFALKPKIVQMLGM